MAIFVSLLWCYGEVMMRNDHWYQGVIDGHHLIIQPLFSLCKLACKYMSQIKLESIVWMIMPMLAPILMLLWLWWWILLEYLDNDINEDESFLHTYPWAGGDDDGIADNHRGTPHICHNHHNRWLCKSFESSVKFSTGYMNESALSVLFFYRVCNVTHGVVFHLACNFTLYV